MQVGPTTKIYIYYIIALLTLLSVQTFTQDISFKHLTADDGLSNNQILDVIQDKTGFIWFATQDGLNRYDGYNFKVYRHVQGDSTSISNNSTWALFEDISGYLWIGTKSGELNRFDPSTESFKHWKIKSDIIKENSINSIFEDSKGAIWLGTYSSGLYRFDPVTEKIENWKNTPEKPNLLTNNYITAILEDQQGNLLVSSYIGLNKFNYGTSKNEFIHFFNNPNNSNSLTDNIIWSLTKSEINPDEIWIGTSNGLTKYNSSTGFFTQIKIYNPQKLQFGNSAGNVIEEITGNENYLWIDSYSGLIRFNMVTGQQIRYVADEEKPNSLISNQINKIISDRTGVMWVATQNGVSSLSPKSGKFNNLSFVGFDELGSELLKNKSITAIAQTENKTIWFGTTEGLYYLTEASKKSDFRKFQHSENIHIWSLTAGQDDQLWIGTYGSGLMKLDLNDMKLKPIEITHPRFRTQSVLFNKSLHRDIEGNLWIGYWGLGLAKFDPKTNHIAVWQNDRNNSSSSLSHNDVWVIYSDSKGRLWIGTNGGGLNLLVDEKEGKFVNWMIDENNPKGFSSNNIYAVIESAVGKNSITSSETVLWIGTSNGLNKVVIQQQDLSDLSQIKAEITSYTVEDGLNDNVIHSIIEDQSGNLWLSTSTGISLFDIEKKSFTNFTKADGLIGGDFNSNSSFKNDEGLIFFGGVKGLNYFQPDQISLSKYIPEPIITNFYIFNEAVQIGSGSPLKKSINQSDEIILSYDQNVFSFEFAALDFNSPQSIQYEYMMEGFDEDWIESGTRRFVTYTNLSSGKYSFKVKSTNADGVWVDNTKSLSVVIGSPWWATGWAYAIYIIIIITGLYTIRRFELNRTRLKNIIRMREFEANKQKELDETKSRFFANLSHEFRTPLMLIKGPIEQLMEDKSNGKNLQRYRMIYRNTQNLQSLIEQLLELSQLEAAAIPVKAKQENIISTLKGLLYSFESLAQDKNITLSFNSKENSILAWFDKDKLEKIINNLLSNAFKFTNDGGRIDVDVEKQSVDSREFLQIRVTDSGIGIPKVKLDKIFDRFFQVDDSSQRAFGGSGIGLALVKELVELHRWEIFVASEAGKGSEFTLKIPLWDYLVENQKIKSEIIDTSELIEVGSYRQAELTENNLGEVNADDQTDSITIHDLPSILLVEDSQDVRLYLYDLLKSDYTIYQAINGKEGISIAQEKMPDLIISDIMMPEMDGMEFCRRIKTDWLTSHIPVILLTAKASGESKIEGLETGADDYLTKPFSSRELFVRIKNLLEQRKRLREKFSKAEDLKPAETTPNPLDEEFLQKAFALIEKNLDDVNFDNDTFAKEMFLSRMQLHRKLQAITGQTPGDFIRTFRLKRAAQLLKENRLPVTQIAFEVGYSSPSQFTRAFTKQFNCTPSEYSNQSK